MDHYGFVVGDTYRGDLSAGEKRETAWAVEDAELAGDGLSLGPAAGNPGRVAPCWQHVEHGAQNKNMARNRYAPYPR